MGSFFIDKQFEFSPRHFGLLMSITIEGCFFFKIRKYKNFLFWGDNLVFQISVTIEENIFLDVKKEVK